MLGYLQYAAGMEPSGCLKENEAFVKTLPPSSVLSMRSPLVCPSEVNKIKIVSNELVEKWFAHFKDQDVVMFNMHDLSFPQQGGIGWHLSSHMETYA